MSCSKALEAVGDNAHRTWAVILGEILGFVEVNDGSILQEMLSNNNGTNMTRRRRQMREREERLSARSQTNLPRGMYFRSLKQNLISSAIL